MKKLILFFILYISFINISFANIWEVEDLKNQIKTLEINYQNLNNKYNSFLSWWIENYAKVVAEWRLQIEERWKSYNEAIDSFNLWLKILWIIFTAFLFFFWLSLWPDFKKRTMSEIKEDIVIWINEMVNNGINSRLIDIESKIDLKINVEAQKFNYERIKDLKDKLIDDSEIKIEMLKQKLFLELESKFNLEKNKIEEKINEKISEVFLSDNQN